MATNPPSDLVDVPVTKSGPPADLQDVGNQEKPFGEKALEFVEPTAEALGTIGGGALGSFLGPAGTVGGAGLGYGMTKEAMQLAKQGLGYTKPRTATETVTEPIKNVLTGATFEAGGRALPEVLNTIGTTGASLAQKISNFSKAPEIKAAKIASEALGPNLKQARDILKQSANDISASQALAIIDPKTGKAVLNAPTAQALLQRAQARDPEFFTNLFGKQEANRIANLEAIAKGGNQTEAKEAREALKKSLNDKLIPTLKTELEAANTAGKLLPKLQGEANRMGEAATQKVEDVRRFTAASPRAEALARINLIEKGQPVGASKYTYLGGDLPRLAEQVATQAAEGSLRFGEASRFAQAAADSLAAHGLKPLTADSVVSSINRKLSDPSIAGNKDVSRTLNRVADDIREWTNRGGVIDAFALDSIRKNSVNGAIKELYPQASAKAQKELAAKILDSVRAPIIDAIEQAGGTGYRQYLTDYAKGSQLIAQTKLGAKALEIYQSSPKEFVNLVEGNKPEVVEEIFGPGNYNLAKQMSSDLQKRLNIVATDIKTQQAIQEQAAAGNQRLAEILKTNLSAFKLPSFFSPKITTANAILDQLEGKVNAKTMVALTNAAKSAKNLDELLSLLPEAEKQDAIKALKASPSAGGVLAGINSNKE